jgi:hypothetical protein
MFRLRHVDFLTSQTFWGGFGWLDTLLPAWLVSLLAASSGLALAGLLAWVARTRAVKTGLCLGLFLCGIAASCAASAFSVIRLTPADLHGRYLLGVYLCLLALCWNSVPRMLEGESINTGGRVLAVCGSCILILYLFSFSVILRRYF